MNKQSRGQKNNAFLLDLSSVYLCIMETNLENVTKQMICLHIFYLFVNFEKERSPPTATTIF